MSSAIAAYLIAAGFMLRYNIPKEDAVRRAVDLWKLIQQEIRP